MGPEEDMYFAAIGANAQSAAFYMQVVSMSSFYTLGGDGPEMVYSPSPDGGRY